VSGTKGGGDKAFSGVKHNLDSSEKPNSTETPQSPIGKTRQPGSTTRPVLRKVLARGAFPPRTVTRASGPKFSLYVKGVQNTS